MALTTGRKEAQAYYWEAVKSIENADYALNEALKAIRAYGSHSDCTGLGGVMLTLGDILKAALQEIDPQ